MNTDEVVQRTRTWLREVVVGLDLCPFARGPLETGRVRFAVSEATDLEGALTDLWLELDRLVAARPGEIETTLVVLPHALGDFDDFVDALRLADQILEGRGYEGLIQLAHFHPDYCFDGAAAADPANYTNRSPYPMWHLLREDSVDRAVEAHGDPAAIPRRNADLMRRMDPRRLAAWQRGELPED